jgi:antitoxin component YwqK of YwqJK toxin-antitoxin module
MNVTKLDQPVELFQKDVWVENGFYRLLKTGRPATGRLTHYHDNGNVAIRLNVRRGRLHGLWEEFFENGDIDYWCTFANGKRDFYDEKYDKYGRLISSSCWLNDQLHGTFKRYELNNLVEHAEYQAGLRHGLFELYAPTKITLLHGRYIEDQPHGWHVYRHENGKRKEEQCWDEGVRIGQWRTFYESGKVERDIHYEKGVKVGEHKLYYENGSLEMIAKIVNGEPHGATYTYDPYGKLSISQQYKNGVLHGVERMFHTDQSLFSEIVWDEGTKISEVSYLWSER